MHAALRARGAKAVITTLGGAGAIITDTDGTTTAIPAIPAPVPDTTGAGDAFVGVLAARLAAGDSLLEAARLGTAAGSLAVRVAGAQQYCADLDAPGGIIHREPAGLVAGLRHTDTCVISDAGLRLAPGTPVVDLGYRYGQPPFLDVVEAVPAQVVVEDSMSEQAAVAGRLARLGRRPAGSGYRSRRRYGSSTRRVVDLRLSAGRILAAAEGADHVRHRDAVRAGPGLTAFAPVPAFGRGGISLPSARAFCPAGVRFRIG